MVSVLIPVLNFNIANLVNTLDKQLVHKNIDYEIIFFEDGSDESYILQNRLLTQLSSVKQIVSKENVGRIKARKILSLNSKYDWLLFLDADVLPSSENFIKNYLAYINSNYDAVYGGITYNNIKPEETQILRWKYGNKYEEISAIQRNKKKYKLIFSANCLMRKSVFNNLNLPEDNKTYGIDSLIGARLKENRSEILHIDNNAIHLGLEKNLIFLRKKEQASIVLIDLYRRDQIKSNPDNSLLKLFSKVKKYRINFLFSWSYKVFGEAIRKNLLSKHPNMLLFQFYRLSHLCHTDLES